MDDMVCVHEGSGGKVGTCLLLPAGQTRDGLIMRMFVVINIIIIIIIIY